MELIGCESAEPLLAALRRHRRSERDWADLLVLDRHGAVMASRTVSLANAGARPSVLGGTLVDIALTDGGDDRPSPAARPDRSGGEYRLDGRFVTDVPGLHCAIAEALLGPGRYFGRERMPSGTACAVASEWLRPFTLTWHDSETARRALADVVEDPEGRLSCFEEIVRLLERCGVTVVLR